MKKTETYENKNQRTPTLANTAKSNACKTPTEHNITLWQNKFTLPQDQKNNITPSLNQNKYGSCMQNATAWNHHTFAKEKHSITQHLDAGTKNQQNPKHACHKTSKPQLIWKNPNRATKTIAACCQDNQDNNTWEMHAFMKFRLRMAASFWDSRKTCKKHGNSQKVTPPRQTCPCWRKNRHKTTITRENVHKMQITTKHKMNKCITRIHTRARVCTTHVQCHCQK